jgi:hypothetical protein
MSHWLYPGAAVTQLQSGGVAAALEATPSGNATVAASLTTGISMAAALAGASTLAAVLTTAITLNAAVAGAASLSADLTTAIRPPPPSAAPRAWPPT